MSFSCYCIVYCIFFVKQKTAYEMRISDWSSDVCSSDLLSSGVTITLAHHALKAGKRIPTVLWMWATVAFGVAFLYFQAHEYIEAYTELNLTLGSGIYGSTFFMLTGFHGLHVTLGTIMLVQSTSRFLKGHFTPDSPFGFEGVA